ncbi:metallophosphoesterase [bacterium]|nr:metallophosphoesterase [bacterium]
MIIAVTADCHLTSLHQHPRRYVALERILDSLIKNKVEHLLVAGDCFDENVSDLSDFENLVTRKEYRHITIHLLPGNHDMQLKAQAITASNVAIYSEPVIKNFDLMSMPCLFLPYRENTNMGEWIGRYIDELPTQRWILIGHGDWVEGMREPNPYEPGVYMPLTRSDIDQFHPQRVVLGHIHKSQISDRVIYPGSPSPLHINETGRRHYLLLNTETGHCTEEPILAERLYFHAEISVLPMKNERHFVDEQIHSYLARWNLTAAERVVTQLRIKVVGYTSDRSAISDWIRQGFEEFSWDDENGLDLTGLKFNENKDLAEIARRVYREIETLDWPENQDEPDTDLILIQALKVIYEE